MWGELGMGAPLPAGRLTTSQSRDEAWRLGSVLVPDWAELLANLALFTVREPHIYDDEDGKHE